MRTVELHLDEATWAEAQAVARAHQWTMEAIFAAGLLQLKGEEPPTDPIWGLFADDPEMVDALVEDAMQSREQGRLRGVDGPGPA